MAAASTDTQRFEEACIKRKFPRLLLRSIEQLFDKSWLFLNPRR